MKMFTLFCILITSPLIFIGLVLGCIYFPIKVGFYTVGEIVGYMAGGAE